MAIIGLNLPTDIRWERVCVTRDMLDPRACDSDLPPKWTSSIAVFKFTPAEEYQVYPGRRIIYFKVVCTITSYQPQDEEIEGAIDWHGVRLQDIADYQQRLKSYLPCNGAMVQVTVAPKAENIKLDDYPYFMDFQPKQRVLYELATDSAERASRSLESLDVKKSAGTAGSLESLDIDGGFSLGTSYSGAGVNVGRTGQAGTKQLAQADQTNVTTTDSSRENRDTQSHTTQISQMYTLLQGYHQGTNRLLFYLEPRPHTLELPSGFIQGPRAIDGIQEFFLIVNQDPSQGDPCLAVRLDTAHLSEEDQVDFDRRQVAFPPDPLRVDASPLGRNGTPQTPVDSGDVYYDGVDFPQTNQATFSAPEGFHIESVDDLVNEASWGSSSYVVSGDGKTLTLTVNASGHTDFRNNTGDLANIAAETFGGTNPFGFITAAAGADVIPKAKNQRSGFARRQLSINLVSDIPAKKVGETWVLKVTSRGLCCCPVDPSKSLAVAPKMVAIEPLVVGPQAVAGPKGLDMRQANELTRAVSVAFRRISASLVKPHVVPGLDAKYMIAKLSASSGTTQRGRERMAEPVGRLLSTEALRKLAAVLKKLPERVTRHDLIGIPRSTLHQATGASPAELDRLQLAALGFPTHKSASAKP